MSDLDRRLVLKLLGAGTTVVGLGGSAALSCASEVSSASTSLVACHGTLRRKIADYVTSARFEDLPPAIVEKAKEQIAFLLGRAFEASQASDAYDVLSDEAQRATGVARGAAVVGQRLRLRPSNAAAANAALFAWPAGARRHAEAGSVDAGLMTLPVALAAGETQRVSGQELLLALVLGYEILGKLYRAEQASAISCSANAFGGYATAGVASRLFGLDSSSTSNALDYAVHQCANRAASGCDVGLISRVGVLAAQHARSAKGESGLRSFAAGAAATDLPPSIDDLGYWEILSAVPRRDGADADHTAAVELLLDLVETHELTPNQVERIVAVLPAQIARGREASLCRRGPFASAGLACSSLPYSLARVLIYGRLEVGQFADRAVVNERLMQQIDVAFAEDHPARWAHVTVHTRDGRELHGETDFYTCDFPRTLWGGWLRATGGRLLPPEQLQHLEQTIANLEEAPDAAILVAATQPPTTTVQL